MVCKMSVRKGFSVLPFTHTIKWIAADMALPAHQHNKLSNLWPQTAAALEGYGLAGHVVGVFAGEEDCHAADVVC